MDYYAEQEAFDIHQNVPLAANEFLVPIVAAQPAHGRLDWPAIDNGGAWSGVTPIKQPGQLAQVAMNLDPGPVATHCRKW
jgi:hypothetical protein